MEKIDFVITWVDGGDPVWLAEKRKYEGDIQKNSSAADDANAECRYRDDGLLKYWFRAVEKFTPWVNRIHFVTCGQKPEWLNENHPKLKMVNHEDFIPLQYLPTFNANTIEMNFHRIDDLAERYVFFNDDTILLQPQPAELFFRNGEPVLDADLRYTNAVGYNGWSRLMFNDYCVVNNDFDIRKSIWKHRGKWFNVKELGFKRVRKNFLCYLVNGTLPVGAYGHLAFPHLKSSLQEIWDRHPDLMEQALRHKFRSDDQVNQWLLCAWNQAKGKFYPARHSRLGSNLEITPDSLDWACELIRNQLTPQICVNDSKLNTDFDYSMKRIAEAFDSILPQRSAFEL